MKRHTVMRCVGFAASLWASTASAGSTVCAVGATTPGIDVSKWQGAIDWSQVASEQQFAIARVSDGTYLDTWFDSYWPAMKAAGLVRGAYQYFEPAQDPIAQADILLQKMGPLEAGMLPPTLDVEATGGLAPADVEAAVQQWVDYVQAQLGVAPIVYTGDWFWDPDVSSAAQAGFPLWESTYCTNCCPSIPTPWSTWAIWQYSDTGTAAGVSGACDMNLWNGDLASLQSFAGGAATGPSGPVCGDGTCDATETCSGCPADCGNCAAVCGDGACNGGETCSTCAADCGTCAADAFNWDIFAFDAGSGGSGGCTTDSECPNVCDLATGTCVQCNKSADCIGGQQCQPDHKCLSVCGDGQCAGDESNQTCCVDCPCSSGLKCVNSACAAGGACTDTCVKLYASECASPTTYHTCQETSGCLAWAADKSCAAGLVCYQGLCMNTASVPDAGSSDGSVAKDSASQAGDTVIGPGDALADAKLANDITTSADGKGLTGDGSKSDVKFLGGGAASKGCGAGRGAPSGCCWGALLACAVLWVRRRGGHHT